MGKVLVNETDLVNLANDLRMNITGDDLPLEWPNGFRSAVQAMSTTLQAKVVTPSSTTQVITYDNGYDGLSQVTVNGDSNLVAANIKNGVSIFGVTGTASSGGGAHTLTVSPNSFTCVNQYQDSGEEGGISYNGFTVGPMNIQYDGTTVTTGAIAIAGAADAYSGYESNHQIMNGSYTSMLGGGQHTVYILYNGLYTTITVNVSEEAEEYVANVDYWWPNDDQEYEDGQQSWTGCNSAPDDGEYGDPDYTPTGYIFDHWSWDEGQGCYYATYISEGSEEEPE